MDIKISYTIYDRLFLTAKGLVLPLVYMGSTGSEEVRWQIFGPRPLVGAEAEDVKSLLDANSGVTDNYMAAAASRNEVFIWDRKALDAKSMRKFMLQGLQRSLTVEEFILQTGRPCIGLYTAATGAVYPKDSNEMYDLLTSVDLEKLDTVPWAREKYKVWPASVYSPCRVYCRRKGVKCYLGEYGPEGSAGWKMSDDIYSATVFTDPTQAFKKIDQLRLRYFSPALQLETVKEAAEGQIAYVIIDEDGRYYTHTSGGSIWLTGLLSCARAFRDSKTANAFLLEELFNRTVSANSKRFRVCPVHLDGYGKASVALYEKNH